MYKLLIRPLLFLFDPEKVHNILVFWLKIPMVGKILRLIYFWDIPNLRINIFGLEFQNAVGLAAGFDKNAEMIDQLADLGFGFVEIGTVTPKPQGGNPRPRIFRLKQDRALINRMGFNNSGMESISRRLAQRSSKIIVGGNIGRNKVTANQDAWRDYCQCFEALFDVVDYFVVNVSSPNTPGLRELQDKEPLSKILRDLQEINSKKPSPKPILLKIAPDLEDNQLDDIVEIVNDCGIDGIIATNTTLSREKLTASKTRIQNIGPGGLSGKPLKERSTNVIRYLSKKSKGNIPIIAAGGIHSAQDALEKLSAGASLVQIYTGFVYEGPALIKQINRAVARK